MLALMCAKAGDRIAAYVRLHGIEAYYDGRDIVALDDCVTADGIRRLDWVRLAPSTAEIREWLGY